MNLSIILPTRENTISKYIINFEEVYIVPFEESYIKTNDEWSCVIFEDLYKEELLKKIIYYCTELEYDIKYAIEERNFSKKFKKHFDSLKQTVVKGIIRYNLIKSNMSTAEEIKLFYNIKSYSNKISTLLIKYKYNKELWLS